MNFQWDLLLLESGFLAIFLTGGIAHRRLALPPAVFRFLFLAGVVKLASGDATWRSLTALALSLLDAAAADAARLVRRAAPALAARGGDRRDARRSSSRSCS